MRNIFKPRISGVTLVEILIVIAIIAVLAAIAYPVTRLAIRSAKNSNCAGNLSQLYKSAVLYATDHDGLQPHYSPSYPENMVALWKEAMTPYVKEDSLWYCPLDSNAGTKKELLVGTSEHLSYWGSFTEGLFSDSSPENMIRLNFSAVDSPSSTTYLIDRVEEHSAQGSTEIILTHPGHGERINNVYIDGHVKSVDIDNK